MPSATILETAFLLISALLWMLKVYCDNTTNHGLREIQVLRVSAEGMESCMKWTKQPAKTAKIPAYQEKHYGC